MLLFSDLHGCVNTLTRLLNQCAARYPGEQLAFCGDLIDRGPKSRDVVEFAMNNAIPTVCGNHEDLAVDFYRGVTHSKCGCHYQRGVWLDNGGDAAVRNWPTIDKRILTGPQIAQAEFLGGRVPDNVLDWMEALPAYLTPDVPLDQDGRRLLVSHTGYGFDVDTNLRAGWFRALWGRYALGDGLFARDPATGEEKDDGYYRVYGHSSVKEALVTATWANIDTGAAYAERGGGTMTAFHWPSKATLTQVYDETPIAPKFRVEGGCIIP